MYHFLRCRWVRLSRISVTLIMLVMMTVSPSLSPLVAAISQNHPSLDGNIDRQGKHVYPAFWLASN